MSAEQRVIEAAIAWRAHVSLSGPTDKHPARRPIYSGALADAVDALLAERRRA